MDKITALKILNLDTKASFEDAKKAYRILAKKYHPDVVVKNSSIEKDAESKMKAKANQTIAEQESPDFNAWFTAFFLKNHIDPFAYPSKVGAREQIEFMVYPENDERYYPCSDKMFDAIMSRKYPPYLKRHYKQIFDKIMSLIDEFIDSEYDNKFLKELIKIKYEDETKTGLLLPSRLEKRLYKIFLSRTHIENPYSAYKKAANKKTKKFLDSETFKKCLNNIDDSLASFDDLSLSQLREKLKKIEFQRLLTLIAQKNLWLHENPKFPALAKIKKIFKTPVKGNGLAQLLDLAKAKKQKILWLVDESGEVVIDLEIAKFLAELGHVVILAVKDTPFFKKVCLEDTKTDPVLVKELEKAHFISAHKFVQRWSGELHFSVYLLNILGNSHFFCAACTIG